MISSPSYRLAFLVAIMLHGFIAVLMVFESSAERSAITVEAHNDYTLADPMPAQPEAQAIKAMSVDNKDVMDTVNRLKDERARQHQAEKDRQRALSRQAEVARKQRIEEQHRLETLKSETAKLAIAHQKQVDEEQLHLKQLAKQKIEEEKQLADMKHQQEEEAVKLANLKKQKADALIREKQIQEAKAKEELARKQQIAALDAAKAARLAGEVDKYKALIINAISQQWILPDNVNSSLSSQFRIRLAPNGAVLEVSLARSSGDPILDRSAQSAIYKASPLPVPNDPSAFNIFREISLTVRPESARG